MRRLLAVAGAVVFATALVGPAMAASLSFSRTGSQIDNPIEQQQFYTTGWPWPTDSMATWIVNPTTNCAWDVDDHWRDWVVGSGTAAASLAAGESVTVTECMFADWWGWADNLTKDVGGRTVRVELLSPSAGLTITACFQPQGVCFAYSSALEGRTYHYFGCINVSYYRPPDTALGHPGDPGPVDVPGSNGGKAALTTTTVTFTNTSNKRISKLSGYVAMDDSGNGHASYCPGEPTFTVPFSWTSVTRL